MTLNSWVDDLIGAKKGQLNTFLVGEFIPYKDKGNYKVKILEIKKSIVVCAYYDNMGDHQTDMDILFDGTISNKSESELYNIDWDKEHEH